MTPERNKELAELLPVHVMRLANANMGLSLMDWNEISNDILDAARLLGALALHTDDEVEAINRRHEHCCYTVTNADWKEREAFQAHDDRATLLRHVDRLTAEMAAERSKADGAPELVEEIRSRNLHDWADSDDCEIISQFHDDVFKILRLLDAEQARRVEVERALIDLNAAIDRMWNNPEGRVVSENHALEITHAQRAAASTLKAEAV